jgi:hypothetical protein
VQSIRPTGKASAKKMLDKTIAEYRDILTAIRDRVAALKGEDKSLDKIVAAKPTAAYDAKWGGFSLTASSLRNWSTKALGMISA